MGAKKNATLPKFDIRVGARTYRFQDVALTKSVFEETVLSYRTVRPMMVAVASAILNTEDTLKFEELKFLATATELSMDDCAKYMDVEKEALLNWGQLGEIPMDKATQLKKKMTAFLLVERLSQLPEFELLEG